MNRNTKTSIVVAIDKNRGIGYKNELLYKIPGDLKRFRRITLGHPVIMGYKTYQSIGHPLSKRTNIVLSRNKELKISGVYVFNNLEEAIDFAKSKDKDEVFIIGGASIYKQAISLADRLYLTIINDQKQADTYFPKYSEFKKNIFQQIKKYKDIKYKNIILER